MQPEQKGFVFTKALGNGIEVRSFCNESCCVAIMLHPSHETPVSTSGLLIASSLSILRKLINECMVPRC